MAKIHELEIHKMHPTQMSVGMIVVHDKKKKLASLKKHERRDYMEAHPIPAVFGPNGHLFITDHHHLGRAAYEAEVETGFFMVEADFSSTSMDDFWKEMDKNKWVHPLDQYGVRHNYAQIPSHLEKLVDDAYRSLAGYVRNAGGYEKTPTAFAEFIWADFFRRSIAVEEVEKDFPVAVGKGLILSRSPEAKHFPGYKSG